MELVTAEAKWIEIKVNHTGLAQGIELFSYVYCLIAAELEPQQLPLMDLFGSSVSESCLYSQCIGLHYEMGYLGCYKY